MDLLLLDEATTRAKKEKLVRILLEKQRRMADSSLYYFCKYVLGFNLLEIVPHWELCRFLERNGNRDCMVLLPRGTFKSTIISVGFVLWKLTKNRDLRVLITSKKEDNPKGWLRQIKGILERNDNFRTLYGYWDQDKRNSTWHSTEISVSGRTRFLAQPTVTASSIGGSEVSQHYDLVICDDVQNDENVKSKEMIDDVERYVEKLTPLLYPQPNTNRPGPTILVGTRWGFDDLYGRTEAKDKLLRKEGDPPRFRYMVRKAAVARLVGGKIHLQGPYFFPKRFDARMLKEIAKTMTWSLFSSQYLNDPQPEGTEVFSLKDLGFYWYNETTRKGQLRRAGGTVEEMPAMLNRFTTIDPSLGESYDSDFSAFITVAVDARWDTFVWNAIRGRMNPDQLLEMMFFVHKTFTPFRMGIESVAFQKTLKYGFAKICRESGTWFPVEELKTDNTISKDMRIRGYQPFVKGHKFFLRVKEDSDLTLSPQELIFLLVDGQDVLADEMLRFPTGKTKDMVDATAYLPQLIFPAGNPPAAPVPKGSFEELRRRLKKARRTEIGIGKGFA